MPKTKNTNFSSIIDHWSVEPEPNSGCWLWSGATNQRGEYGYGHLIYDGKDAKAHRLSWELANGPIQDGMYVLHKCNISCCVNPDHLEVGDHKRNMAHMVTSQRSCRGTEKHSAILNEQDVSEIRELLSDGWTHRIIAQAFGVKKSTIGAINKKITWRHA
jgi:hypothetical protein